MSIYLRKDTGKWMVAYKDETGKRRDKSFGKGEEGHEAAIQFHLQIQAKKQSPPTPGQSKNFQGGEVDANSNVSETGTLGVVVRRNGEIIRTGSLDVTATVPDCSESSTGVQNVSGGIVSHQGQVSCNAGQSEANPFGSGVTGTGVNPTHSHGDASGSSESTPVVQELGSELMTGPKPKSVPQRKSYAGADPKVVRYLSMWDMYERNPDPTAPITMGELFGEYVRHAWVRGCSTDYIKIISDISKNIMLPFFGDTSDIKSIDYATHIVPFLKMLKLYPGKKNKIRSDRTINGYARYLKAIFNYAVECEYITHSPMRLWKPLKEVRIDRELTFEDAQKIMKCSAPHLKWALEIVCVTGVRVGRCELFNLKWKDVDFENNRIRVYSSKTNTSRYITFKEDFKKKLLRHKEEAETEYLVELNGQQVTSIERSFKFALKIAQIGYHVRPYDFRHLFATELLNKGGDLAAVSKLLGHARITTTVSAYYETRPTEIDRAISLVPSLPED